MAHVQFTTRRWSLVPLFAAALFGCSHADPFADGQQVDNPPFTGTPPIRLTYNIGHDVWPTWSTDGNLVWYAAQDSLSHDKDECLATIPPAGGTMTYMQCPTAFENNLTEVLQQPTLLDGVLAFALADLGTFPPEHVQYRFAIWLAGLTKNDPPRLVMRFPYVAPSGKLHDGPIDLRWVRPGLLAYIGFEAGCCNKDSQRFGEQIVLLDVSGQTPVKTFIPDTYRASSLAVAPDGLSIYYTVTGGGKIYQRVLATGAVSVVHDFGPGEVIRDPDIVGHRLVAIIRGQHNFGDKPPFDSVQVDHGGVIMHLDLTTGAADSIVNPTTWFRNPRLSPGGDRIVAEGFAYRVDTSYVQETTTISRIDTTVSNSSDLWLLQE
jgi:hypothetical protein